MYKNLVLPCFLMCFICTSFSQEKVTVSGQLLDVITQETLPFANIAVHTLENNILLTGAITDNNGRFELFDIPIGKYTLYFSYIGYTTTEQDLIAGGLNTIFDLGKIELEPSAENLEEVEVVGKQATTNSDLNKKTFNLADNIAQSADRYSMP